MAFIIGLSQDFLVLVNKIFNPAKIMGTNTFVTRKDDNRLKPKVAFAIWSPDMDVGRLATFIGVKMETKSSDSQDGWHELKLPWIPKGSIFFAWSFRNP